MLVALLALIFVANGLVYEPRSGLTLFQQFHEYNTFWNKTHADHAEKVRRFENFQMNAKKIAESNARTAATGVGARFGFTKFSDLSFEEFKKMNGFVPRAGRQASTTEKRSVQQPGGSIDWVAQGKTTPVKDQGQCGSCWAFSATETVESANLICGKGQGVILGPQEIVDCDTSDSGCNGGDPQEALGWVQQQGGQDLESCYPYTAEDGTCSSSNCQPALNINSVTPVPGDEGSIYQYLTKAPLSICCDAEPWQNYQGGVLTADQCGDSIDHAIQLTGYSQSGNYWIVRNSWGADWGENGFIWLQYGQNTCGITSEVTYATAC
jgi:C1A family cysteine protease